MTLPLEFSKMLHSVGKILKKHLKLRKLGGKLCVHDL